MKSISVPLFSAFIILIAGLFFSFDAAADENTCILKADENKVHIVVWDEDSEEERQDKIFEGWLKPGQEKKLKAPPVLLFSVIKKSKMTGHLVITMKLAKMVISFECRSIV